MSTTVMYQQVRRRSRTLPTLVVGVALGVVAALAIGAGLSLGNPFRTRTVDHSAPPVLVELRELDEYHAAQAQLEIMLDQERDVQYLPSFLAGERVQFVAVGTVDGVVHFGGLTDDAVHVADDGSMVQVRLPAVALAAPVIDHTQSHVMNRDRGLFDRLAGVFSDNPTSEDALFAASADKMADAAAATDLVQRTERSTRMMLQALFRSLGYDTVMVTFAA